MASRILVLHGPTVGLLGKTPGTTLPSVESVDSRLRAAARKLGVEVNIVRSNHEGALVDALEERLGWFEAVIINPGPLAWTSQVLKDALSLVEKPAIEVHLARPRRLAGRSSSIVKDACAAQLVGERAYEEALERLAHDDPRGKKKKVRAPAVPVPPARPERAAKAGPVKKAPLHETAGLSRLAVRRKIDAALSRQLTSGELLAWARHSLQELQLGAAAEVGQRETLEEALQELVEIARPGQRLVSAQVKDVVALLEA